MKSQDIRKRLFTETAIVVLVVGALAGGTYYAMTMLDEYTQTKSNMENEVNAITASTNALREKFAKVKGNLPLYEEINTKRNNNELSIDRVLVRKRFDDFRNRFYLNNMILSVEPPQEIPASKRQTSVMMSGEARVVFEALTDVDVYKLLAAMHKELPGTVKMRSFTLTRDKQVTQEIISEIAQKGQYPLMHGEIKFLWFGIQSIEPAKPNDIGANAPMQTP